MPSSGVVSVANTATTPCAGTAPEKTTVLAGGSVTGMAVDSRFNTLLWNVPQKFFVAGTNAPTVASIVAVPAV